MYAGIGWFVIVMHLSWSSILYTRTHCYKYKFLAIKKYFTKISKILNHAFVLFSFRSIVCRNTKIRQYFCTQGNNFNEKLKSQLRHKITSTVFNICVPSQSCTLYVIKLLYLSSSALHGPSWIIEILEAIHLKYKYTRSCTKI